MPLLAGEHIWRRHVEWLRSIRHEFNGRLIVGIVTQSKYDQPFNDVVTVQEAFAGMNAEFVVVVNDSRSGSSKRSGIGEGCTFLKMLERLQTNDPNEVIFYGHAKGVTHHDKPIAAAPHIWSEACFETLFRNRLNVVASLDRAGVTGPFRRDQRNKYFSGAFFAFRSVDVFRRNWNKLQPIYGCVERWPDNLFDIYSEGDCVFGDHAGSLYDEKEWPEITQRLAEWKSESQISPTITQEFAPGLTLITPTGDRPDAFRLCEQWVGRQTYQGPLQWIVVDDGLVATRVTAGQTYLRRQPQRGEGHTLTRNLRLALPHVKNEKILIVEDDEWYAPTYLERMSGWLDSDALVGGGHARYYWPRLARFREFPDHQHASLCRTGLRSELLPELAACCRVDDPSVDLRLWKAVAGKRHDVEPPLVVGMKGMPGRPSGGGKPASGQHDNGLDQLRAWIGNDVENYRPILPKSFDPARAFNERIVVYTVVVGDYDALRPPTVINPNVRYVAITDSRNVPAAWEVMRPPKSNDRSVKHASRRWKILGPQLFPDSDWTIYVDGQLQLAVDPLALLAECESWGEADSDFFLFRHQDRNCIYAEATAIAKYGRDLHKNMQAQMERYRNEQFPEDAGLYLGGMLIRRGHGACDIFSNDWWREVETGSHRDQISLPVALEKSGVDFNALPANWWQHYFLRHAHTRGR